MLSSVVELESKVAEESAAKYKTRVSNYLVF